MPKLSVIMSEYNTDVFLLEEAIKSILNQTFKDFEFIIVDDCGKNDVASIVKKYNDKRIKVLKNESNKGLVYSLNRALETAKSNLIIRMDTDDYAYENRLELQYNFAMKHKEYDVIAMRCDYYDGEKVYGNSKKVGLVKREELLKGVPIVHPTVLMKKDKVIEAGKYKDFNRCEDYCLWINLFSNNCKLYVMDEVGLRYTIRKNDYKKRKLKTRKGFFKLLKSDYKKLNPSFKDLVYIYLKNFIAGLVPAKVMERYHNKKFGVK